MLPLRSGIYWELEERATRLLQAERRFYRLAYPDEYTYASVNDWLTEDQLLLRETREILNPMGVPDPSIVQGQYSRAYPLDRYGYRARPRHQDRFSSRMDPWKQSLWEEIDDWSYHPGTFYVPQRISTPTIDHLERYLEDFMSPRPNPVFAPRETPVETWRLLAEYPPFEVSNTAKVRNSHTGVELRQFFHDSQGKKSPGGGMCVRLPKGKKEHIRNVASLVRQYFDAAPIAIPEPKKANGRHVAVTVDPRFSDLISITPAPDEQPNEEEPMITPTPITTITVPMPAPKPVTKPPLAALSQEPVWKPLPKNHEYVDGYTLSNLGDVVSPSGTKLTVRAIGRGGDLVVMVELLTGAYTVGGHSRILKHIVPVLMLKAFEVPYPGPGEDWKPGYKDGNPLNVRLDNLEWVPGAPLTMRRKTPAKKPYKTAAYQERQAKAEIVAKVDKPAPAPERGHEAMFAANQALRQQLAELQEQLAQARQPAAIALGPEKIIGFPIQVGQVVGTLGATALDLGKTSFSFEELTDLKKLITRAHKHLAIEQEEDDE